MFRRQWHTGLISQGWDHHTWVSLSWWLFGSLESFLPQGRAKPLGQEPMEMGECLITGRNTPVPSGLWDSCHWAPQTCTCSVSSGGPEPAPHLQWEGLCSPSPYLEVWGLERCGKPDRQWRTCWVPQPSPCLFYLLPCSAPSPYSRRKGQHLQSPLPPSWTSRHGGSLGARSLFLGLAVGAFSLGQTLFYDSIFFFSLWFGVGFIQGLLQ